MTGSRRNLRHGTTAFGLFLIILLVALQPATALPAVANFSASATDLSVAFTDLSTNSPTGWSWTFGDGATSTAQNPTHTYTTAGTYTVSLNATNADGSDDVTKSVTVVPPPPVAGFSSSATYLSVVFTDQSTNTPTSWSWTFGDGATSTEKNPTHIYTTAGTYTVALTATNAGGSNVLTKSVTVAPPAPVADFSMNVTSGMAPLTVTFTDQSTNTPTSWAWDFGDGATSTEKNPTHTYTAVGIYTVSLTATNAGGSNVLTKSVTVAPPAPVADFSMNATYLSAVFTDRSTNSPTSWAWDFGDGNASSAQNPTHVYAAAGTYAVSLNATNAGGSNTTTTNITVTPPAPLANFSMNATYLSVTFTDHSTNNPTSWKWDFGDGATSTEQNSTHTYTAPGTYDVALRVMNAGGASIASKEVTVTSPAPVADFSMNATHLSVVFTDRSTNSPTSWAWDFGDGNVSSDQNPTHVYAAAGTYAVSLNATNAGGSNTTTTNVTVALPAPVADFSASTTYLSVVFTDHSTNNPTSWVWNFGDGVTSTAHNPTHAYTTAGTYTVSLNATNDGGSNTTTMQVTVTSVPASDSGDSGDDDMDGIAASGDLKEGASVTLAFRNTAISSINFTAAERIEGIMVRLETTDDPATTLSGPVYQYINTTLSYASNDQLDDVFVTFEVPKSWISARGIKVGDIALRYLDGDSWIRLSTELIKETSSTATYRASAPGISSFAIAYAKGATVVPTVSTPTPTVDVTEKPTTVPETPEPPVTEMTTATPTQNASQAETTPTSPPGLLPLAGGAGAAFLLFRRRR